MAITEIADTQQLPFLDDDIYAIIHQLKEIESQRSTQPGKYADHRPPDYALTFLDFEAELKHALDGSMT